MQLRHIPDYVQKLEHPKAPPPSPVVFGNDPSTSWNMVPPSPILRDPVNGGAVLVSALHSNMHKSSQRSCVFCQQDFHHLSFCSASNLWLHQRAPLIRLQPHSEEHAQRSCVAYLRPRQRVIMAPTVTLAAPPVVRPRW